MSVPALTAPAGLGPDTDRARRLALAQDVLAQTVRRVRHGATTIRETDPLPSAGLLPVAPPLAGMLPGQGLPRGGIVALGRSRSLLLAALSQASGAGSWIALVGLPDLGLVAAAEHGLDLTRTALIPNPGDQLVAVLSVLLDGLDLVVAAGTNRLRPTDRARLAARARDRRAVLIAADHWPGADLQILIRTSHWEGVHPGGFGRLRSRHVQLHLTGRGAAQRGRTVHALLPGPDGQIHATKTSLLDHQHDNADRENRAG